MKGVWPKTKLTLSPAAGQRQAISSFSSLSPAWQQDGGQCVVQTTSWSPCSRSCGMGVSSRVSNDNAQCKLVKETRLCNIRPCSSLQPLPLKVRATPPPHITLATPYRPRLSAHISLATHYWPRLLGQT